MRVEMRHADLRRTRIAGSEGRMLPRCHTINRVIAISPTMIHKEVFTDPSHYS